jgi:hypothetical protein
MTHKIKVVAAELEEAGKLANGAAMGARFGFDGHIADGSPASEKYIAATARLTAARASFEAALAAAGMVPAGPAYGEGINWPTSWAGAPGMVVMSSGSSGWPMVHFWSAASLKKSAQYRAMCARVDHEEAR